MSLDNQIDMTPRSPSPSQNIIAEKKKAGKNDKKKKVKLSKADIGLPSDFRLHLYYELYMISADQRFSYQPCPLLLEMKWWFTYG